VKELGQRGTTRNRELQFEADSRDGFNPLIVSLDAARNLTGNERDMNDDLHQALNMRDRGDVIGFTTDRDSVVFTRSRLFRYPIEVVIINRLESEVGEGNDLNRYEYQTLSVTLFPYSFSQSATGSVINPVFQPTMSMMKMYSMIDGVESYGEDANYYHGVRGQLPLEPGVDSVSLLENRRYVLTTQENTMELSIVAANPPTFGVRYFRDQRNRNLRWSPLLPWGRYNIRMDYEAAPIAVDTDREITVEWYGRRVQYGKGTNLANFQIFLYPEIRSQFRNWEVITFERANARVANNFESVGSGFSWLNRGIGPLLFDANFTTGEFYRRNYHPSLDMQNSSPIDRRAQGWVDGLSEVKGTMKHNGVSELEKMLDFMIKGELTVNYLGCSGLHGSLVHHIGMTRRAWDENVEDFENVKNIARYFTVQRLFTAPETITRDSYLKLVSAIPMFQPPIHNDAHLVRRLWQGDGQVNGLLYRGDDVIRDNKQRFFFHFEDPDIARDADLEPDVYDPIGEFSVEVQENVRSLLRQGVDSGALDAILQKRYEVLGKNDANGRPWVVRVGDGQRIELECYHKDNGENGLAYHRLERNTDAVQPLHYQDAAQVLGNNEDDPNLGERPVVELLDRIRRALAN
jgi:hypothetical protein